jgi:hypothetical protein
MSRGRLEIFSLIALFLFQLYVGWKELGNENDLLASGGLTNNKLRTEWLNQMLGDPNTGKIPNNVRANELQFVKSLETNGSRNANQFNWHWEQVGPRNIGGRTRALQIDISNPKILLAGGASGGIFRSENGGDSWTKVSEPDQNLAITSIAQDHKSGKQNNWYACTGELRGGNQISGNSAYAGDGLLKSTDGGKTWIKLNSFQNPSPQLKDSTDYTFRLIVSKTDNAVYLASGSGIHCSKDEGKSWVQEVGTSQSKGIYTDVIQTPSGRMYATANYGGLGNLYSKEHRDSSWKNISPSFLPNQVGRMILAVDKSSSNDKFYILMESPNTGKAGADFRGNVEHHSLFKFERIGNNMHSWNLSSNLPVGPNQFDDYISQSGYCMDIAVSPHDSNIVVIGGTNLYISHDGFKTDTKTYYAGGYGETTAIPDFQMYPNHHPDLQTIVFHPAYDKIMYTGSDGGIHKTLDLYQNKVVWLSLNNGYVSTQFYTLSIDHVTGSNKVMGGLQDNGTLLSVSGKATSDWTLPLSYDGGFCEFSDQSDVLYASKQLDGIAKIKIDSKGERINWTRIDPPTSAQYLFINPYMIHPSNKNIMYLPIRGELWVNSKLNEFTFDGQFNKQSKNWNRISLPSGFQPSAITFSEQNSVLYLASTSGDLLKVSSISGSSATIENITQGLDGRGYINSIALNPNDTNEFMVVYSNYNTYSDFTTQDGGKSYSNISGNLEGKRQDGVPAGFDHLNNGPSCRVGKILYFNNSKYYFIGTSIGLFATQSLDSMNTDWQIVEMGENSNLVISDLEYRMADEHLFVSTFGNGIFKCDLNSIAGISQNVNELSVELYPNPCNELTNLKFAKSHLPLSLEIYEISGRKIYGSSVNTESFQLQTNAFPNGQYLVVAYNKQVKLSSSFLVNH